MQQLEKILKDTLKNNKELFTDQNFVHTQEFAQMIGEMKITLPNIGSRNKIDSHYCSNILFSLRKFLVAGFEQKLITALKNARTDDNQPIIVDVQFINGYINLKVSAHIFATITRDILNKDIFPTLGLDESGKKRKVNVEYCSINPTGFLHIGHARNAILGDSIARILDKANFEVTKEYYVNDAGNQIALLAQSVQARFFESINKSEQHPFPEGGYIGNEIKDIAKLVKEENTLEEIGAIAVNYFLNEIKKDLSDLKIHHDVWSHEKDIINSHYIEKAIDVLKKKEYIYSGMRDSKKAAKGKERHEELLLLKTTTFGDDEDRPLTKADGEWTYLAPDIGYHLNKIERGFNYLICVLGADHDSYARRIKIAVKLLKEDIEHRTPIVQMVSFEDDGKHVKFSKRAGNSIRTHDFIQEIHPDILRFMMLAKTPGTPFVFDYESACTISMKNPVFYIQYAHARGHSIFRNTQAKACLHMDAFAFEIEEFQELLMLLSSFKNVLNDAASQLAPHTIANYAQRVAEAMHKLWQVGKIDNSKRVIIEDNEKETQTRLAITQAFLITLATCLEMLGINAPESMN